MAAYFEEKIPCATNTLVILLMCKRFVYREVVVPQI